MLNNYYIPYSKERINMTIDVLKKYNINIENSDILDMLIAEAKYAQTSYDFLSQFKKSFKTLATIIIPIVAFVAKKISEETTPILTLNIAILAISFIILISSLIFSFIPIIKDLLYPDYNKYNKLIYDLRQIKIFYAKNLTNNSI